MSENEPINFDYLKPNGLISLTSYYKSGKGVPTPVEYLKYNDKLYVSTTSESYKVKRIKGNPNVKIAPCTMRGKVTGPVLDAKARIIGPDEEGDAKDAFDKLYSKFSWRIMFAFRKLKFWNKPKARIHLEITY